MIPPVAARLEGNAALAVTATAAKRGRGLLASGEIQASVIVAGLRRIRLGAPHGDKASTPRLAPAIPLRLAGCNNVAAS
jgi:hypothetical protein